MEHVIAWCGFVGAWLLVAGPVYQAALELQEEEIDRDGFAAQKESIGRPAPVSGWWWLLPPVAIVLQSRASKAYRRAVVAAVPDELLTQFLRFNDKAMGWLLVAAGAFLLAVDETWNLRLEEQWSSIVFWMLLVVMLMLALGFTVHRLRRSQTAVARERAR